MDDIKLEGLTWQECGQVSLAGSALDLFRALDAMFTRLAAIETAREHQFPTFISADKLARLDYFKSFPHLVTFPVTLDADDANLKTFSARQVDVARDGIKLEKLSPVREVLSPAACYHFYPLFEGQALAAPQLLTTRCRCFRREEYYKPLRRQWNFAMREIVCIGSADEVKSFLERYRARVEKLLSDLGITVQFKQATDPFFNPSKSAKYLAQRLDPVKHEALFGGDLAIASLNFHRNYFGEAFSISRGGEAAFSGCVAFGLERWMFAIAKTFGPNPGRWPDFARRP